MQCDVMQFKAKFSYLGPKFNFTTEDQFSGWARDLVFLKT